MALHDRDVIDSQLSQIDLLVAMYPSSEELVLDHPTQQVISELRQWCDQVSTVPPHIPDSIYLGLNIAVGEESSEIHVIPLTITIPFKAEVPSSLEAPLLSLRVRQPDWMTKAEVSEIVSQMPTDDVFSSIEHVREAASKHIKKTDLTSSPPTLTTSSITRVWFYFPSLSTREKRDDLVIHAPTYELTGFVLAGKPGILCLEGSSSNIDAYMKYIKTESWGDIPSHQKKVSERYREQGKNNITRKFTDMQEITDKLGEKRGERANRSDMKALEIWLSERGLGEAFDKVLM